MNSNLISVAYSVLPFISQRSTVWWMHLYENVFAKSLLMQTICLLCILFTFILAELLLLLYFSIRYFYTEVCCCLFISLSPYFFILTLLLYFCLFVNLINESIIFGFGAFVYYFKNTISIFIGLIQFSRIKNFLEISFEVLRKNWVFYAKWNVLPFGIF